MWKQIELPKTVRLTKSLNEAAQNWSFIRLRNSLIKSDGIHIAPHPDYTASFIGPIVDFNVTDNLPTTAKVYPYQNGMFSILLSQRRVYLVWATPPVSSGALDITGYIGIENSNWSCLVEMPRLNTRTLRHFALFFSNSLGVPEVVHGSSIIWVDVSGIPPAFTASMYEIIDVWHQPPNRPAILTRLTRDEEPAVVRYAVTHQGKLESRLSDYTETLVSRRSTNVRIYGTSAVPAGGKVHIYRWTSVLNTWQHLTTINELDTEKWWYLDTAPLDWVNPVVKYPPIGSDYVGIVDAAVYHADRYYLASGNKVRCSRIGEMVFTPTPIFPVDGAYVYFHDVVEWLFSWGSHVLVLTPAGWYRLVESDGSFYTIPVNFPIPISRWGVKETEHGLFILAHNGLWLLDREENLRLVWSVDMRRLFDIDLDRRNTPVIISLDETVVNVTVFSGNDQYTGVEGYSVDMEHGSISGAHTILNRLW